MSQSEVICAVFVLYSIMIFYTGFVCGEMNERFNWATGKRRSR